MSTITIETAKCSGCGICSEECPSSALCLDGKSVVFATPRLCLSCGHCAAVCPAGAITSSDFSVQPIDERLPLDRLLFHRKRSVRSFKKERVEREKLASLVEYAEKAPSSHNHRNRSYMIVTGPEEIRRLSTAIAGYYAGLIRLLNPLTLRLMSLFSKPAFQEMSHLVDSFKHLLAQHREGGDGVFRSSSAIICIAAPAGSPHSKDDCLAAQHYMMLFGKTVGIDSFVVGYAQAAHKRLEKLLGVDKGLSIWAVSAFGYGRYRYANEVRYAPPAIAWR